MQSDKKKINFIEYFQKLPRGSFAEMLPTPGQIHTTVFRVWLDITFAGGVPTQQKVTAIRRKLTLKHPLSLLKLLDPETDSYTQANSRIEDDQESY